MKNICLHFSIHEPFRLRSYRFFDIGQDHYYYDDFSNKSNALVLAKRCYVPMNNLLLSLINANKKSLKVSFSISGSALEQFEMYTPEVIEGLKKLAETGCVEFVAETDTHSLISVANSEEFAIQVKNNAEKITSLFGQTPKIFKNTSLIYSDDLGKQVYDLGYQGILAEGSEQILGWKSPNYLYCNDKQPRLKVFLRNFKLTDDVTLRFSSKEWNEWPLTAEKYVSWIKMALEKEEILNLMFDYETFGKFNKAESGIFDFFSAFVTLIIKTKGISFANPSDVIKTIQPISVLSVPQYSSCVDEERDLSAWLGNNLQKQAFDTLCSLQRLVRTINDESLIQDWNRLQTSENFYYMSTKFFNHHGFSPYQTPYEAFINYMNVISDFSERLNKCPDVNKFNMYTQAELDAEIAKQKDIMHKLEDAKNKKKVVAEKAPEKKTAAKTTAPKPQKNTVVKKETTTEKKAAVKKTTKAKTTKK